MHCTILHLSDAHIKSPADRILSLPSKIASSCFDDARGAAAVLIFFTGDITYSGKQSEFDLAKQFLESLRAHLQAEGLPNVQVLVVPGNHDCELTPEDSTRTVVIEQIQSDPTKANDDNLLATCTKAQQNYFRFRAQISSTPPSRDHPLWTEYDLLIANKRVKISAINASWMSRLHETPGSLVFPIDRFKSYLQESADFRLALVHHPLGWYCQSTHHPLRRELFARAHAIFSGHEHIDNSFSVSETRSNRKLLLFESPALQPHDSACPSYQIFRLELEERTIVGTVIELQNEQPSRLASFDAQTLDDPHNCPQSGPVLLPAFANLLEDPGAHFTHPDKSDIRLSDIYVPPQLKRPEANDTNTEKYTECSELLEAFKSGTPHLLLGEDKAGKSTLLQVAFRDALDHGFVPVLLFASTISKTAPRDLPKFWESALQTQYKDPEAIRSSPREKILCLIDDLDELGSHTLANLLAFLKDRTHSILATASTTFEAAALLNARAASSLAGFTSYYLQRFGHEKRLDLIKRWCSLSQLSTKQEFDVRVHQTESLINSVIGKNLVPSQPLYVLVLLQGCDSRQFADLQNGTLAHYYQFLITKSLAEAGVKAHQLNELFNYLSQLSWFFRSREVREIDSSDFRGFNDQFSKIFTTVELSERLTLLTRSGILLKHGDAYRYSYPYVYYFYLGKYLADNLHRQEVKETVALWCDRLDRTDNAYAILFLTHHRGDPWVIQRISAQLKGCFQEFSPATLSDEVSVLNDLIDKTAELVLKDVDVGQSQSDFRKLRDTADALESKWEEDHDFVFLRRINVLLRTGNIFGQILRDYYGSLERTSKEEMIRDLFDAPLRFVRGFLEAACRDPTGLVLETEDLLSNSAKALSPDQKRELARSTVFNVLGMLTTSFVAWAGSTVGTDKLRDDVRSVVRSNPENSYRLIEIASRLLRPGAVPFEDIKRFAKDLEGHPFSFAVLQSLGALHVHLFHTRDEDKQRLCGPLKISMARARAIDKRGERQKLTRH